jgi:purine-binding chemotaxis protein CheW
MEVLGMDTNTTVVDTKQYIILRFDAEQYGIDITYIDNIVRLQPITRVPHTQSYFLGVINLRGEIIPVMSLRRRFELPDKENTNATRILIIKVDGNKIGILVDEIREVVTLSEEDTEKLGSDTNDMKAYITAVGKYNESLISILNISSLIADIENE